MMKAKGGERVILLKLDKQLLEKQMERAGFANYDDVADDARKRGLKLSARTIYNMANGENWSREKLEALCFVLGCQPADIVRGWQSETTEGSMTHTHARPQLAEESQAAYA
jgi:DNA-binding Xre family transcriptional regulator